tara:strand:- start:6937 stop:7128 length:192 start_codon:yes stop_codon:yes gene_type:complete
MKLNATGIASAFVFLIAASVFRLGQQPTFPTEEQEKLWVEGIQDRAKAGFKARKTKVKALHVR